MDCSRAINEVEQRDMKTWSFRRYVIIMEYEHKPTLPPPIIVVNLLWRLGLHVYRNKTQTDASGSGDADRDNIGICFFIRLIVIVCESA